MFTADRVILAPMKVRLNKLEAFILQRPVRNNGPRRIIDRRNFDSVAIVYECLSVQPMYSVNIPEWLEAATSGCFGYHIDWTLAGAMLVTRYPITAG